MWEWPVLTITNILTCLEALADENNEKWQHTRFLAWSMLKPWSKELRTPEDVLTLPGDEERTKDYYARLKAEGRMATVRKQTTEEQELMARINKLNKK